MSSQTCTVDTGYSIHHHHLHSMLKMSQALEGERLIFFLYTICDVEGFIYYSRQADFPTVQCSAVLSVSMLGGHLRN